MRIASVGGGPAGLYFALLWKRRDPGATITVYERNRPDDTFGFGVVFSDATLATLAAADPDSERAIRQDVTHWDDLDVHVGGRVLRSTGHGFCGLERRALLARLRAACLEVGVDLRHEREIDDVEALRREHDLVLGADGVASGVRRRYDDAFGPSVDLRPNRFVWLGTTFPFEAFTFHFKPTAHGLLRTPHAACRAGVPGGGPPPGRGGAVWRCRERSAPLAACRCHPLPAFGDDEDRDAAHAGLVFPSS